MLRKEYLYIRDIEAYCHTIDRLIGNRTEHEFLMDEAIFLAVIRCIEVIGEAVKNVSSAIKDKYPQIQWSLIARTRDLFIHHYFRVDNRIVWTIATKNVPELLEVIQIILATESVEKS